MSIINFQVLCLEEMSSPETEIISQSENSHLHKASWIWGLGKQYWSIYCLSLKIIYQQTNVWFCLWVCASNISENIPLHRDKIPRDSPSFWEHLLSTFLALFLNVSWFLGQCGGDFSALSSLKEWVSDNQVKLEFCVLCVKFMWSGTGIKKLKIRFSLKASFP